MAILDIRKEQEEEITGIKFDDSCDYLTWSAGGFVAMRSKIFSSEVKTLCKVCDIDNLIAALHKAKELAGKSEMDSDKR